MKGDDGIVAGIAPRINEAKIAVARATLAVRRGDDQAAEVHLRNAQRALTAVELSLPVQERRT